MCKVMDDLRTDSRIDGFIKALRLMKLSDEEISQKLVENFNIDKETADGYLKRRIA